MPCLIIKDCDYIGTPWSEAFMFEGSTDMFKPYGFTNSLWYFLLFWYHFLLGIVKIGLALKLNKIDRLL